MTAQPKITVLLSTYNGEKYLTEQLDSILRQTYPNFLIVVRDDGSTDNTPALLSSYASKHPNTFYIIESDNINRGASGSFSFAIEFVLENKQKLGLDRAYMMFCDQDDIWYETKIEKQVSAMLTAEQGDQSMPVLVHTDLQVVSEDKEEIAESLIRYQGLEIKRNRFPNIVISNLVTGCTALINEALAVKSVPISNAAIMHDWWLAMVASAFGKLIFLDIPLIHYRQHGSNTIGAKEYLQSRPVQKSFWRRLVGRKPNQHLFEVATQAADFRRRFGQQLSTRNNTSLRVSACMTIRVGFFQRLFYRLARRF